MIRAVIDTNVLLAARRSRNPQSPTAEIITRWAAGSFTRLHSSGIIEEYAEKLAEFGLLNADAIELLARLLLSGEEVEIKFFHTRYYPCDADDIIFLLTALNGQASHLLTYDDDLMDVSVHYPEFITCRPVEFLAALRG